MNPAEAIVLETTELPRTTRGILTLALGLYLCLMAVPLNAAEMFWSTTDGQPLIAQVIGDSAVVGFSGAPAAGHFMLVLEDESGAIVAMAAADSDDAGEIAATMLWERSGVVGCDALNGFGDLYPDPDGYRFARFDEAEQILAGRSFRLRLLESATALEIASLDLPFVVGDEPRFFFSDGSGCPRNTISNVEDVYIGGRHLTVHSDSVFVFLVPSQDVWSEGMALNDARSAYQAQPQWIELGGADTMTELLWQGSASRAGTFDGFVRPVTAGSTAVVGIEDWRLRLRWPPTNPSKDGLTIPDIPPLTDDGN